MFSEVKFKTKNIDNPKIANKIPILMNCCPGKAKSFLMFPLSFPQAIILPAKETEPMISPKSMMESVPKLTAVSELLTK